MYSSTLLYSRSNKYHVTVPTGLKTLLYSIILTFFKLLSIFQKCFIIFIMIDSSSLLGIKSFFLKFLFTILNTCSSELYLNPIKNNTVQLLFVSVFKKREKKQTLLLFSGATLSLYHTSMTPPKHCHINVLTLFYIHFSIIFNHITYPLLNHISTNVLRSVFTVREMLYTFIFLKHLPTDPSVLFFLSNKINKFKFIIRPYFSLCSHVNNPFLVVNGFLYS